MLKRILAGLLALALAAMPMAAGAASPCPMMAHGQMAAMDHTTVSPMNGHADHKSAKSCAEICAAMAAAAMVAPGLFAVPAPSLAEQQLVAVPQEMLVASQPGQLDRPPRIIA